MIRDVDSQLRISSKKLHYLDIAYYPTRIYDFFKAQIADSEVQKLAKHLVKKEKSGESMFTRLRQIQQYIHDKTYHLSREDRVKLFGYLSFDDIPYPKSLVDDVFSNVEKYYDSQPGMEAKKQNWLDNKALERCVGCNNETFHKRVRMKNQYRGIPPLMCGEEATLAAALSVLAVKIPIEKVVIIGSPVHFCTFIRPMVELKNGCLFDSKMLYLPKDMDKFGDTPEERKRRYMAVRFGALWFVVHSGGYANIKNGSKLSKTEKEILSELDNFFGN